MLTDSTKPNFTNWLFLPRWALFSKSICSAQLWRGIIRVSHVYDDFGYHRASPRDPRHSRDMFNVSSDLLIKRVVFLRFPLM